MPRSIGGSAASIGRQGRWAQAQAEYERIVELQPGDVLWRQALAETYVYLREYAKAEAQLDRIPEMRPDDIQSRFWRLEIPLLRDGDASAMKAAAADTTLDVESPWSIPRARLHGRALRA